MVEYIAFWWILALILFLVWGAGLAILWVIYQIAEWYEDVKARRNNYKS